MTSTALSPTIYTFGSMSLGADFDRLDADIAVARRAMEAGVWFHSSPTYSRGVTFMILRMAFDEAPHQRPPLVIKIRDGSPRLMRFETEDACRRLGIDGIDVAQMVAMTPSLVNQLIEGTGPLVDELAALKDRGLIRSTLVYLRRGHDDEAVAAAQHPLVDGLIFYWNAFQRECSTSAWDAIVAKQIPVFALRTLGGGLADTKTAARRASLSAVIDESGCKSEAEFNVRLAASFPNIKTTIGGTANLSHLEAFLSAADSAAPLPHAILSRVVDEWEQP